jgi:hypothetical protein
MRIHLCWICGKETTQTALGSTKPPGPFYLEIRIVRVSRPYSKDFKTKPVYVCHECSVSKLGLSGEGENLNK